MTENTDSFDGEFEYNGSLDDDHKKPAVSPTLVIGLGGTGTEAVRFLKRRLVWLWHREEIEDLIMKTPLGVDPRIHQDEVWRRFEMEGGPPIIQLLAVDTWPWTNQAGKPYLNDHEYAYIGGYNANKVLDNLPKHPEIAEWWRWPSKIIRPGQIHSGARQIRAIGRLSIYRRYRAFWRKLKPQIDQISSLQAKQDTEDRGYQVSPAGATKRVYIISSLCGGTGAGVFLDIAAVLRHYFEESAIVTGIFGLPSVFLPELGSDLQRERVRANAYSALKEIDYFQSETYRLHMPDEAPKKPISGLLNRIYLIERINQDGESLNSIEDVHKLIANQVFLESITEVGAQVWEYDVNVTMERREKGGKLIAYNFSSFANSSLVIPRDDILEYCELRYTDNLISNGILRSISPDDKNEINKNVRDAFRRILNLVTDSGGDHFFAPEEDIGDDEFYFDDEMSPAQISTAQLTLSDIPASLEQFQQEFNSVKDNFGLSGASYFIEQVAGLIDQQVTHASQTADSSGNRLRQLQEELTQLEQNTPRLQGIRLWPLSEITEPISRRYDNQIRSLHNSIEQSRSERDTEHERKNAWMNLQQNLTSLKGQLNNRIETIKKLKEDINRERERLFSSTRPAAQQPFEMFTMIFGREYIEKELYPDAYQAGLGARLSDDTQIIMNETPISRVDIVTSTVVKAGHHVHEKKLQLPYFDKLPMRNALLARARSSVRGHMSKNLFEIRNLLQSNQSKIQMRLRDLFSRCQPFWRYDLDKGGFSESNLEQIVFVGVGRRDERDWKYILRDFPGFSPIETNDPTRIDACKVVHGLPIEYLFMLDDYKNQYDMMFRDYAGPMQLDARWEPDGSHPLPELIGSAPTRDTMDYLNRSPSSPTKEMEGESVVRPSTPSPKSGDRQNESTETQEGQADKDPSDQW